MSATPPPSVSLTRQIAFARHQLAQHHRLASRAKGAARIRAAERAAQAEAVLTTLQSIQARRRRPLSETRP